VKAAGIAVNLAIVAYLAHSLRRRLNLRGADLGVCLLERERRKRRLWGWKKTATIDVM